MPTIKLIPSTYYLSNSSYLSVSNASNMYDDTDSTNYATVTNSRTSTTSYYIFLKGFDFSQIPSSAVVNSFTVRLKAYESGVSTSSSYRPYCVTSGSTSTSTYYGYCDAITTSASVHTFTMSADWDEISADEDFSIRINCRRASRNTTGYMYIYGAEIEVDYTLPNPATVTTSLVGNGTISPSGATSTYEGEEFELTITPTNASDPVSATKNGVAVELVAHGTGSTETFTADDHTTSGIQSGTSYASYCIGHTAESPSSSGTSSNMYASSGSTGYAEYTFDFSGIPSNAVIEDIEVRCYGHRESSTIDSTHVSQCVLYNGSAISEEVDFPSTSNSIITIVPTDMPTRSELDSVTLRHYVGYYGGLVLGISFDVTYSTGTGIDHYTYTYTVDGDATIIVTIGETSTTLYVKDNGSWTPVQTAYIKTNGAWVETDVSSVFQSNQKYIRGN